MADTARRRVVIVGGGFGGLFTAKFLRRAPVDVVLVDQTNHHLFQPLLYQVATGILSAGQVAPPLREVLRRHENVEVQLGEVTGVDLDNRSVSVRRPDGVASLAYDYLVVATGVSGSYFGHDEFAQWAPAMKTLDDALDLRSRLFGAFEMAELTRDDAERQAWLTFVVVGGGPTGVEVAGQIKELARRSLQHNYRHFDPGSARVVLFEGGDEILATFGDRLSGKATKELGSVGVEVRVRTRVVGIDEFGVTVSDANGQHRIESRTKVWAAGVRASPLAAIVAAASGAPTDRAGRLQVLPDCSLPGHPEVFVIGDVMALDNLPGVAEVAMQTGIHVAETIKHESEGAGPRKPFVYRDMGSMATVARFNAVVEFKGLRVAGLLGWLMWVFVHLTFLTGFKNRFLAGIRWALAFGGRARDERAITSRRAPW